MSGKLVQRGSVVRLTITDEKGMPKVVEGVVCEHREEETKVVVSHSHGKLTTRSISDLEVVRS